MANRTSNLQENFEEQQLQIASQSARLASLEKDLALNSTGELILDTSEATYSGLLTADELKVQSEKFKVSLVSTGETITRVLAAADGIFARIKAGFIQTTSLLADNIRATKLVVSESLSAQKIASPVIETDEIQLKDQNSEIKTTTQNSQILIKDYTGATTLAIDTTNKSVTHLGDLLFKDENGKTTATITASGDAYFAGNVGIGQTLETQSASISGELYAESARIKKLRAESIDLPAEAMLQALQAGGLEAYIATISAQNIKTENISGLESQISTNSSEPVATNSASLADLASSWPITDPSNDVKIEGNLTIYGTTTLAQTIIAGPLTQDGTFLIDEGNSINVLGGTLYLQNRGTGGIDLLAGKVTIDTQGNAVFEGNLTVKGTLFAGLIKPTNGDITFDLAKESSDSGSLGFGQLIAKGENGQTVFSLNASGSAEFKGELTASLFKINREAIALEPDFNNTLVATASAGQGIIKAGSRSLTIITTYARAESLIYLTPTSRLNGNLYLARIKDQESFTVEVSQTQTEDVKFNWLIIN